MLQVILILCFLTVSQCVLPDYIRPCHANDPELPTCIVRTIETLRPKLIEGIPELDVPPIEPLELPLIRLTKGINCNVTDLKVWGPSSFEIQDLRANVPKNRFAFIVKLPHLHFDGNYELNSRILLLHLKGKGPIHGNFTDYSFSGILKGNRVMKDGNEYLKFDKMKLDINPGKTAMKLENLFNGNPTLGAITNDVINDSNDAIFNEIRPALEHALAELFTSIANKITLKFTYKELFL